QGVLRRREGRRPGRLLGPVGDPDDHRHRPHRAAIPLRREEGAVLMIENRPWLTFVSHAVLIAGVVVIAFPIYVTFVASTLTLDQIVTVPMPLGPGDQLVANYTQVLKAGTTGGSQASVARMLGNSLVM